MLTKVTVEAALNAELDDHLGYERHEKSDGSNHRNGYSSKTVQTDVGQFELETPRDRNGDFDPQLVKKNQRRFTAMDDKILFLYAQGMTTREIVTTFKEMYGADVSASLISKVTDAVIEQVVDWQSRPLAPIYPIVNLEGHKELLGLWLAENEGAKFWLNVMTELQNRGLKDILIACVDGLKGFPDAIATAYPDTQIQLCIMHMVRNSLKFVPWKDYKAVTADLKQIYQSVTEEEALQALEQFAERWDAKYPQISKSWRSNWENLNTLFAYPEEIRKAIYTTNAIESLNSVIRKATKKRKIFRPMTRQKR
jgi:transposase-like protein